MRIVIDTSAILAVAMSEPQRPAIIRATKGCELAAPQVLPFEVGNALTALFQRRVLDEKDIAAVWNVYTKFPIDLVPIDIAAALRLATKHAIYAFDAYVLSCAFERRAELLTLDARMMVTARAEGLQLRELEQL